ncbi:MAG TPA: HAD family hydrolase [Chitinispirillaceae bacterium]|nr:HAD family hydrolase [Chitinispirillaceae bacterium]
MNKALFLDRDGIINEDTKYLHKAEDVVFIDGIFDLCSKAQQKGYILIVVTNQAGIARGYFTEEDVLTLHEWMKKQFAEKGIQISGFYYSPYHPSGVIERYKKDSDCRKPKPGLFIQAARDHNIDINQSLMVGDKQSDRIQLEGLRSVVIKSRYSPENYDFEKLLDVVGIL